MTAQQQQRPLVNVASLDTIDHSTTKHIGPPVVGRSRYSRQSQRPTAGGIPLDGVIGNSIMKPRESSGGWMKGGPENAYGIGGGISKTIDVGKGLGDTDSPYVMRRDTGGVERGGSSLLERNGYNTRQIKSSMSMRGIKQVPTSYDDAIRARSISSQ